MNRDIAYTYVSNKYMFMKLTKSKVYDLSILITYSTNMIFRENNGNSIIIPKILTYIYQHDIHEHDIQHGINYPKNPNIHLSWQLTSSLAYIYHAYHTIPSNIANKQDIIREKI